MLRLIRSYVKLKMYQIDELKRVKNMNNVMTRRVD